MEPSRSPDMDAVRSAHLVGIGGAGMTPLATILLQGGVRVTGSDLVDAPHLEVLRALGAQVEIGHRADHLGAPDVVVISSAVPDENPEIQAAQARGIAVVKHSRALGSLMSHRKGLAVAGTHGKGTITALIAFLLDTAGLDPTFHVGAEVINYGLFGRRGQGQFLVAEADEFDRRFLDYEPYAAVITSIEPDHLDYFGDFDQLLGAYQAFVYQVRPGGLVVINEDDERANSLDTGQTQRVTYGTSRQAHWRVINWEPVGTAQSRFTLRDPAGTTHGLELGLLGEHNARNAAAAVAVAFHLGAPMEAIAAGLAAFRGTRRRLERVGEAGGVTLIDDYAHHPTEVRAALRAARAHWPALHDGRASLWAIYQPHTEHRTASLFDAFARCFDGADHVFITPAYMPPGRILSQEGATAAQLVAAMHHPDARCLEPTEAAAAVAAETQPGDGIVVMGAGDIWTIERPLLETLARRFEGGPLPAAGHRGPRTGARARDPGAH